MCTHEDSAGCFVRYKYSVSVGFKEVTWSLLVVAARCRLQCSEARNLGVRRMVTGVQDLVFPVERSPNTWRKHYRKFALSVGCGHAD
jgi:hypothetical protein